MKRSSIGIYNNPSPSKGIPWYEQYRVKDEDTIRKVNEILQKIN